eukprot:TRINITY_DN17180_c0_g1_i1.p1 TRINITY_DN17180_c0_g1~~TRINITY_DN17180_c0_g1_i1.p1  ORF type:complete len:1490 (-),score=372.41 TRINITY_DN17180_c0_g1_i1:231-4700(-)
MAEFELQQLAEKLRNSLLQGAPELVVGEQAPDRNSYSIFTSADAAVLNRFQSVAKGHVKAKRAMGSMVGLAVGDALGAPLEFVPIGKQGSRVDLVTLHTLGELNKFELKPGQWTDDTSMALCIADSLLLAGNYDGQDVRKRYWNWWHRGYNNAFRKEKARTQSCGLGDTSSRFLELKGDGFTARCNGGRDEATSSSLMRLAPLPLFFQKDPTLTLHMSAESSLTTQPGSVAADACAFWGYLLLQALTRNDYDRSTAREFLDRCVREYVELPEASKQPELTRLLRSREPKGSTERCWNWRDEEGPYLSETLQVRGTSYRGQPVSEGSFGSYCMDGLAIALHCFYHTSNFLNALIKCVNFLGDADTNAAICGQLAGAFYGYDAIDSRLVQRLNKWDDGQIALRGALLYAMGLGLTEDDRRKGYKLCEGALRTPPASALASSSSSSTAPAASAGYGGSMLSPSSSRNQVAAGGNKTLHLPLQADNWLQGDRVYYQGGRKEWRNGNKLFFAMRGYITGPSKYGRTHVAVQFDENSGEIEVSLKELSRRIPDLPAGYRVGEIIYYCGTGEGYFTGDELRYGCLGEVVGRSTAGDGLDDSRVKVMLDGNRNSVDVFVSQLSHCSPVARGGLRPGDRVFYCGPTQPPNRNGDQLFFGLLGEACGRTALGDGQDNKRVKVRFDSFESPVSVWLTQVARPVDTETAREDLAKVAFLFDADSEQRREAELRRYLAKLQEEDVANPPDYEELKRRAEAAQKRQQLESSASNGGGRLVAASPGSPFGPPPSSHPTVVSAISNDYPSIPGGWKVGDDVFYTGQMKVLDDGTKLMYGSPGVIAEATMEGLSSLQPIVLVDFVGVDLAVELPLAELAAEAPPLPKGYAAGDRVYFCGGKQTTAGGHFLMFALAGEVVGPATPALETKLKVLFDGNLNSLDMPLVQLSPQVPVIPGGYRLEQQVYYCGEEKTFPDGDRLLFGLRGEVVGRSTAGDASDDRRLKLLLEGNQMSVSVFLSQVSTVPPLLPGGFVPGDHVKFNVNKKLKFQNGDQLYKGMAGEVVGRGTMGDGTDDRRVKVKFEGNSGPVNVFVNECDCTDALKKTITTRFANIQKEIERLERETKNLKAKPAVENKGMFGKLKKDAKGGGAPQASPRTSAARAGAGGPPAGFPQPAAAAGGGGAAPKPAPQAAPSPVPNGVPNGVHKAPAVANGVANGHAPVLAELPGGLTVGEKVYYCSAAFKFPDGNRLEFALPGDVLGPATPPDERRAKVHFEGNTTAIDILVNQLSRSMPQIPGGYQVGDKVFFCGELQTFANGDALVWGGQGKIVGRSTFGDTQDDKRVKVLMDACEQPCTVWLTQVAREMPIIPGGFQYSERIQVVAAKRQTFKNGDRLDKGMEGQVIGISAVGDNQDNQRVKVRLDGNKGPTNVFVSDVKRVQGSGSPAAAGGQQFAVGQRVEACYNDVWYPGTVVAPPQADEHQRWSIQCDADQQGCLTLAYNVRPLGG